MHRKHQFPATILATVQSLILLTLAVPSAFAGTPVDPDSLTPPPPPGAECQAVGPSTVICHTAISFPATGEPIFDIACGTLYQTSTDDRVGIRWYDDGLITKRQYTGRLDGTWSLTPDGSGPSIRFTGNWISTSTWTTPGDNATLVETFHGLQFHATSPGLGNALLFAGHIEANLTVHGINTIDEPLGVIRPEAIAAIESVLCA